MWFQQVVLAALFCAGPVITVAAQDAAVLPSRVIILPSLVPAADGQSPVERVRAVERWTRDYAKWREWHDRWRNRPEPGWFAQKERREPPVPPEWLAGSCGTVAEEEAWLIEGCRALREWAENDEAADALAQQLTQIRASHEAPVRTQWWERVHLDALWPMTQSGSSAFGVAGMHATFHVTRRFQVFMTPGVILMRLPLLEGGQTWSAATDWGFSFRLLDFRMPAMGRPSTVHFNIARVWVMSTGEAPVPGELYLAGLSLSFKQR